jgi:DNA-binding CsgD family transcriptional regulator
MRGARQLFSCIGELLELEDPAELPYLLAEPLKRLIPYDFLVYNEIDTTTGAIVTVSNPNGVEAGNPTFEAYAYQHPLITYYQRTRDSNVLRLSDHIDRPGLRRLDLYNEFLHPLGIEEMIVCTLPAAPSIAIGLVLTRERRDFSADECVLLSQLRPYVLRAYRSARQRKEVRRRLDALESAFNKGGHAVIALGADGEFAAASADADRLVSTYCSGPLETLARDLEGRRTIVKPSNGRRLVVTKVDSALLIDEEVDAFSSEHLRSLGLTVREAQVLQAVRRGAPNKAIAHELGVTIRTIKKHLERVYEKLGVESRTAALAVADIGRN